jgi:2-dehydropantoate 2-reductase
MVRIAVIGIGAMGCLFGARLSAVADVALIGRWPEQLAALQNMGLQLVDPDGRSRHYPLCAANKWPKAGPARLALILVKSQQTERAARQAAELLAPDGIALTLQNGLGNLETLAAVVGAHRAAAGVTTQGATVLGPGLVRHAGHGPTHLGRLPDLLTPITAVAELFRQAALETLLVDNVDALIWGKLAVSAAINPLTALLGVANGYLAENRVARTIMLAAAQEVATVAAAEGVTLPYPDAGERALAVAQATAANQSSMLQDVQRGATTEIDAICGAVMRLGRRHQVATPVNEQLWRLIKRVETGRPLPPQPKLLDILTQAQ